MKKLFLIFALALVLVVLFHPFASTLADDTSPPGLDPGATAVLPSVGAGADEAVVVPPDENMPPGFFTWEALGTFSGAVALVVFLVQLLKVPIDKVWKIPTQYVVYVLSVLVLLLAQAFVPSLGGFTAQRAILCLFNGALVALSAMSTYDIAIAGVEGSKLIMDAKLDIAIKDEKLVIQNVLDITPGMTAQSPEN